MGSLFVEQYEHMMCRSILFMLAIAGIVGSSGCSHTAHPYADRLIYRTSILVYNLPSPWSEAAPVFRTLHGLNVYYDAADGGDCNDSCLAEIFNREGDHSWTAGAVRQMAPDGQMIDLIDVYGVQRDAEGDYDCRIRHRGDKSSADDRWVYCMVLSVQPAKHLSGEFRNLSTRDT